MNDDQDPKIHVVPTAKDEAAGAWQTMTRMMEQQRAFAAEVAKTRRALYLAYKAEGFTDAEALELCKSVAL